ncbi:hypothetical protein GBN33_03140 [Plesiomonas shigelloides]|uniref:hypothetical protein n=1 Tax=Plesiomonas shigelloides TaxID=703 RepID=UPI0012621870|nr:hypothetical protein [Plesiomonas shigelloides]KAB7702083.1 hypothetical protein GBN33_03140 [Plesiomonas shigelloides]
MSDNNIDRFDSLVGIIFEEVYSSFPKQIILSPCKLMGYPETQGYNSEGVFEHPLSDDDKEFFYYTVLWLKESGFIIGDVTSVWDAKITLSLKGLQLLKTIPDSVSGKESLGDALKHAMVTGAKERAAKLVSDALSMNNVINLISAAIN